MGVAGRLSGTVSPFRAEQGTSLRRRRGQGPHLAKRWEPRGFSRVAAAFSSYDGDLSLPLGLALGSPIFPSGCERKLGVALESPQGRRAHRQQPTRLSRPWDPPGKNTGVGCHFLLQCMKVKSESEVAQSCPIATPWTVDGSPPGSPVPGILQARTLEWVAISFSNA